MKYQHLRVVLPIIALSYGAFACIGQQVYRNNENCDSINSITKTRLAIFVDGSGFYDSHNHLIEGAIIRWSYGITARICFNEESTEHNASSLTFSPSLGVGDCYYYIESAIQYRLGVVSARAGFSLKHVYNQRIQGNIENAFKGTLATATVDLTTNSLWQNLYWSLVLELRPFDRMVLGIFRKQSFGKPIRFPEGVIYGPDYRNLIIFGLSLGVVTHII